MPRNAGDPGDARDTRDPKDVRWYRKLLRLYPRDFRDEYAGEMTRLYRDRAREESRWRLWASLVLDLLTTAPSEHWRMLRQDLRHAYRSLRRTPVITLSAVLTLALGIGANTAVFSVVHGVLLRPLPYPDPDQLVELFEENRATGASMRASALNYLSWADQSQQFQALGAFSNGGFTLTSEGAAELLRASIMTASVSRVLAVAPILGRTLQPIDELRGSPRVVLVSESLWRTRFGGDPAIVGRAIALDGERYEIVGVVPRAFREVGRSQSAGAAAADVVVPMPIDPAQQDRGNHVLRVIGRLRQGVSIDQAREEMRVIAANLEKEFPATNTNWGIRVERVTSTMVEPTVRVSLGLVFVAVTMMFLVACANIGNLLLARGIQRQTELAIRATLGAGRARLVRQLMTESGCLALIGGAAGVTAALVAQPLLQTLLPATLPRRDELGVDGDILAFGVGMSVASVLAFGIVPALRASRVDVSRWLTGVGRSTQTGSQLRLRQALLVGQIAVATVLLIGAALLMQTFVRLQRVPLGFDPEGVVTARVSLPGNAYRDPARTRDFYDRLLTTLDGLGLPAAAIGSSTPFGPGVRASFQLPDRGGASAGQGSDEGAVEHTVSGGYFDVLGIPLLAGRSFETTDTNGSPPVAIVTQRLARLLWSDANPVGQTIERGDTRFEVVGVVGDVRGSDGQGATGGGADRAPRAAVYLAARQMPQRSMTVLARSTASAVSVAANLREAVQRTDPSLPVQQPRAMEEWLEQSLAPARMTTTLGTVFAVCALLLAAIGIYGVLAHTVASRTKEIGVRVAMGATRSSVVWLVVRGAMLWVAGGTVIGLLCAFAVANAIATLLFEVPARDPLTFAVVAATLAIVALFACVIPATRAARTDPALLMRTE